MIGSHRCDGLAWRAGRPPAWAVVGLVSLAVATCAAPSWQRVPHDEYLQIAPAPRLHALPPPPQASGWWGAYWDTFVRPLSELLSPEEHLRGALGGAPALDVNAFGQVPDSSWYVNRLGRGELTSEDLRRGPPGAGPPPADDTLTVVSGKTEGVSPGLFVVDSRGLEWVVKLDPASSPELASAAEAISTRLLWAAGYHVPENHVAYFDPARLRLAPDATTRDDYNREVPLTEPMLRELLTRLAPGTGGAMRALFSRLLPGTVLGPWAYEGTRLEDPNDIIPHERRRSLRGLWLFSALINNTDTKHTNTLETFIAAPEGRGLGRIQHYLIDFGSSLGSHGNRPKPLPTGYDHIVSLRRMAVRLMSLGFYYPYYLGALPAPFSSVGLFEAEVFEPRKWNPALKNPAFDAMTRRDLYWAGSVLARFTPEMIEAAVAAGRYSDPRAATYVTRVFLERRRKLLLYAFSPTLALDRPRADGFRVRLEDLEVSAGLRPAAGADYLWSLRTSTGEEVAAGKSREPVVELEPAISALRHSARLDPAKPFLTLTWWRPEEHGRGPRVELYLRVLSQRVLPVGLWREVD